MGLTEKFKDSYFALIDIAAIAKDSIYLIISDEVTASGDFDHARIKLDTRQRKLDDASQRIHGIAKPVIHQCAVIKISLPEGSAFINHDRKHFWICQPGFNNGFFFRRQLTFRVAEGGERASFLRFFRKGTGDVPQAAGQETSFMSLSRCYLHIRCKDTFSQHFADALCSFHPGYNLRSLEVACCTTA